MAVQLSRKAQQHGKRSSRKGPISWPNREWLWTGERQTNQTGHLLVYCLPALGAQATKCIEHSFNLLCIVAPLRGSVKRILRVNLGLGRAV